MQITAIAADFSTVTLKNLGADWNRPPAFAVKAGPIWQTAPPTTSGLFTLQNTDTYRIWWNGGGKNVYLPWGYNPDLED
jgi:hypothetical protein